MSKIRVGDIYTQRSGRRVRVIATDRDGDYPIVCLCQEKDGCWRDVILYTCDGFYALGAPSEQDLVDLPTPFNIRVGDMYLTAQDELVRIICNDRPGYYPVVGYIVGGDRPGVLFSYEADGSAWPQKGSPNDLVKRIT